MTDKDTVKFTVPSDDKENMRRILRNVYEALTEKGYNPVNQIVGYLLTEDPTYITNYNNARSMIRAVLKAGNTQSISPLSELSAEPKSSAASSRRFNQSFP